MEESARQIFEQRKADTEKVENADFETNMRTTKLVCIGSSKSMSGLLQSLSSINNRFFNTQKIIENQIHF